MLKENLPSDLPYVFISSVSGQGIAQLKDLLWQHLNSESNKILSISGQDSIVHRNKDLSSLRAALVDMHEDEEIVYIDEDDVEDVEDLEDFEYEDEE